MPIRSSEILRWKSYHKYSVLINIGDYFSAWCILEGNTNLCLRVRAGRYHILCLITCRAQPVMQYPVIKLYLWQDWKLWGHSPCNYMCFKSAMIIIFKAHNSSGLQQQPMCDVTTASDNVPQRGKILQTLIIKWFGKMRFCSGLAVWSYTQFHICSKLNWLALWSQTHKHRQFQKCLINNYSLEGIGKKAAFIFGMKILAQ